MSLILTEKKNNQTEHKTLSSKRGVFRQDRSDVKKGRKLFLRFNIFERRLFPWKPFVTSSWDMTANCLNITGISSASKWIISEGDNLFSQSQVANSNNQMSRSISKTQVCKSYCKFLDNSAIQVALKRCFFSVTKLDHTFAEARFSASSRLLVAGKNTTLSMVWISSSWTTQRINNEVNSSSGVSSETRDYNVIRNWLSYSSFQVAVESNDAQWVTSNFRATLSTNEQQNRNRTRVFFFPFFPAL